MERRFVLQGTWLGCNGIFSRCAFAFALLFGVIGAALLVLERRNAAVLLPDDLRVAL